MPLESFDTLMQRMRTGGTTPVNPLEKYSAPIQFTPPKTQTFKPVVYDVPTSAIYDRLNDGTYVAKYENYLGATGNENRLGMEQSAGEQIWNGLVKNARKAGNYALDATVGTVAGVFNALEEGSLEGFWNNDFSKKMDDWNKQLDYSLPNYYTDEQKSRGLLGQMATANFWANDVAGGLAFVGGALLPELAIGALTGGATIGGSIAKAGFKAGAKDLLKAGVREGVEEVFDPTNYMSTSKFGGSKISPSKIAAKAKEMEQFENGVDFVKSLNKAAWLSKAGTAVDTGLFLARTSGFEAGMEARHNFKEAVDSYVQDYQEKNGKMPSLSEMSKFTADATQAANGVFAANMAILSVSNAAMFGKAFNLKNPFSAELSNISKAVRNRANSALGLGIKAGEEVGELAVKQATKTQRLAGNVYKVLGKASVEGLYEEGFQGVAGKTMQNILEAKYDPDSDSSVSMMTAFTKAFSEQYGTKEGWKEIVIGSLIGWGAGAIQGQGFEGIGKNSRRAAQADLQAKVDLVNRGAQTLRQMNRASSVRTFRNQLEQGIENGSDTSLTDSIVNAEFIKSQSHLKTTSQIEQDYNDIIDAMELGEAEKAILGDNAGAYKETLKAKFKSDLNTYQKAKSTVEALNLGAALKGSPIGNVLEVEDALMTHIFLGQGSLENARKVASEIEEMTGTNGIFDSMEFINNLTTKQKTTISELKTKERELARLQERFTKYGMQASGVETPGRALRPETAERRQKMAAEQLTVTQQEIEKLTKERDELKKVLEEDLQSVNVVLTDKMSQTQPDVLSAITELDKLDNYISALRKNGKTFEADSLENMVKRFKDYSDMHREAINTIRAASETNFWSSKKGKALQKNILGEAYTGPTKELLDAIKENDVMMDRVLQMTNLRGQDRVDLEITRILKESDQLSEREKHKLDSMLRMLLNAKALQDRIDSDTETVIRLNKEPEVSADPLEGDTVVIKQKIVDKAEDLDNLKAINDAINSILAQVDFLRNKSKNSARVLALEKKISDLKRKKNAIEESQKQQQEGGEQGNSLQPTGVVERQQEKRTSEGEQGQTTQPTADDSNSNQLSQEIEKEIETLEKQKEEEERTIRVINTPEYVRLDELMRKEEAEGLTDAEKVEKDELVDDIDQWSFIVGTVANGLRLSDLIRQKAILENAVFTPVPQVENPTTEEVYDGVDIGDKKQGVHYSIGQSYDAVTSVRNKKGLIEVSGISPEDFIEALGIEVPFTVQEQTNNILLNDKEDPTLLERINTQGKISILPRNESLKTNYSIVYEHTDTGSRYSQSSFASDFAETMDPQALYDTEAGEALQLEVDPNDPYNQAIIEEFKDKPEALKKELSARGVIRIRNKDGDFVSVMKQKRKNERGYTKEDESFAAMRDQVFNNDDVIDSMLSGTIADTSIPGLVVSKVYIGHPNFNISRKEDGSHVIESRPITKEAAKRVEDIGYIDEKGEIKTRSGKKDKKLDTTFTDKFQKRKGGKRIPIVVIKIGKKRIAYPVKVSEAQRPDHSEFSAIFNSDANTIDKVTALNRYLAENGIDITDPGNAFVLLGNTNLNTEFFNKKLAQLNSINYFYNLDEWVDGKVSIPEILSQQATIDIDLTKPFHSPKLKMDATAADIATIDQKKDIPTEDQQKHMYATKDAKEALDEAQDELDNDC